MSPRTEEAGSPRRPWLKGLGGALALGAACVAYGTLIERNWFTVRYETVPVLPPGAEPVKVLHLSDIHLNIGQHWKMAWLRSLAELEPDLVVNTGDNLTHPQAIAPLLSALRPLTDLPGVFVPGSNDYYAPKLKNPASYFFGPSSLSVRSSSSSSGKLAQRELDTERMHAGFEAAGWANVTNRHHYLMLNGTRFNFSGVDDPHLNREKYAGWPSSTSDQTSEQPVRIALAHAPYQRVLDHFTGEGAGLILAGHTHGGQLRIPGYGALVSNCDLPPAQARGLTEWRSGKHRAPLNVSGGIGTSRFAPIRFACRPEAVLMTLVGRSEASSDGR